jgi:hypothetical protein
LVKRFRIGWWNSARPKGVVDDAKAIWLIERIDEDGEVNSPAALNLLRRCCVKAQRVPQRLMQYLQMQEARMAKYPGGP